MIRHTNPALAGLMGWHLTGGASRAAGAAEGVHLRLLLHPDIGLPVAPVVVGRTWGEWIGVREGVTWMQKGQPVTPPITVSPESPVDLWLSEPDRVGAVLVDASGDLRVSIEHPAAGPDGAAREFAARSSPPYALAAPSISRVVIRGDGEVQGLRICSTEIHEPRSEPPVASGELVAVLALPLPSDLWYAGVADFEAEAAQRVARGVGDPHWIGVADDPGMRGLEGFPDDELARVSALTAGLDHWLARALSDPGQPPQLHETQDEEQDADGGESRARMRTVAAAIAAASDPGVARHLGLMALDVVTSPAPQAQPILYEALTATVGTPLVGGAPMPVPASDHDVDDPQMVFDVLARVAPELPRLLETTKELGVSLTYRAAVGVVPFDCPPDPPPAPEVKPAGAAWLPGRPPRYRQSLTLRRADPGPVALSRRERNGVVPLGEAVQVPNAPTPDLQVRHTTLLPGRPPAEAQIADRSLAPLSDAAADPDTTEGWNVHSLDLIGRASAPAVVDASPPSPPPPPLPALEPRHVPKPDGTPGTIEVRVRHPGSWPPGLPEPVTFELLEPFVDRTAAVTSHSGLSTGPCPHVDPWQTKWMMVRGRYATIAGLGPVAEVPIAVAAPAPPPPPPQARAVRFASLADPTGTAYLTLGVPNLPGIEHCRVLRYDEADVRHRLTPEQRTQSRAARANIYLDNPAWFGQGVTVSTGLEPGAAFQLALSGSLRSLVLLRFVPTSPTGDTLDPATCPLIAGAVPDSTPPPSPRIEVRVADGTATVAVSCLDPDGLVDAVRLRRSADAEVTGPRMPAVAEIDLGPPGADGVRTGGWRDPDPPPPYMPVAYTAEARRAHEPALPPGTVPAPGEVPRDAAAPWSRASNPVRATHRPAVPEPVALSATDAGGTVDVTVDVTGEALATGAGAFQLEAFLFDREPIQLASARVPVAGIRVELQLTGAEPDAVQARLVDPEGRTGSSLSTQVI